MIIALVKADKAEILTRNEERRHPDRENLLFAQDFSRPQIRHILDIREANGLARQEGFHPPGDEVARHVLQGCFLRGDAGSAPLNGVVYGVGFVAMLKDVGATHG
ncbi:MAG: hypothetical protein BWY63_01933 [Chloroflexi bacterium ADurb.Bin360]|nr:MAG: hypothetical protein BWY63_01933 [Chloroflexi bacterium ADurb.Bin360]